MIKEEVAGHVDKDGRNVDTRAKRSSETLVYVDVGQPIAIFTASWQFGWHHS